MIEGLHTPPRTHFISTRLSSATLTHSIMCPFFHAVLGAGMFFLCIIVYSVGYCKLKGAVGYSNKTVRKLGILTRNVAISLVFSVLSSLACEYALLYMYMCSVQSCPVYYRGLCTFYDNATILFLASKNFLQPLPALSHSLTAMRFCDTTVTIIDPFVEATPYGMAIYGILVTYLGAF